MSFANSRHNFSRLVRRNWLSRVARWRRSVDERGCFKSTYHSPVPPFLPLLAPMNSAYTMTASPPSKANYALLSPYVYVTDRRVATAGHDSGFWSSFSLCSIGIEFVGRGGSKEGYADERVQSLYTIGVRWAWKGMGMDMDTRWMTEASGLNIACAIQRITMASAGRQNECH